MAGANAADKISSALLKRGQLMKIPQALEEAQIPRQGRFADTPNHPQEGFQQRKLTLRPILMPLAARIVLLRVIDNIMQVARQRLIGAGRVGIEPAALSYGHVGGLLHGLHREIAGRLEDDLPLPVDPRNNSGPIFVIVAPAGLTLLAAPTWPAP